MTPIQVIEWTWTGLSVFGVAGAAWALTDGYLDRHEQQIKKYNGHSRVIVKMNLRMAHASMVLHIFFLTLGIFALLMDDPEFSPTYAVFGCAYILVAASNVRALLLNQMDRVLVRRKGKAAAGKH